MNPLLSACLGALFAGLIWAPSAAAKLDLSGKRLVVGSGKGFAVIKRSPFGIVFKDRGLRTVLRELPNQRLGPVPLPETEDPEPYTVERDPDNALYAPLTYEVGVETHEQWNGSLWPGDTLFSRRSGTTHSAQRVIRARRIGEEGVRLVVATSEAGRRLIVRIEPDAGGAIRVRARPSSSQGVITMGDSFAAAPGEGFHGFGGRHGTVDKRGEKLYGFTEQENLGGEETIMLGLALLPVLVEQGTDYNVAQLGPVPVPPNDLPGGYERYLFPNGMNAAYWPQASFISSRGYAFLVNQMQYLRWRMGNDRADAWQVQASAPFLDYSVVFGPGRRRATGALTKLTGRHRLPPAWAQGPMLSRAVQVPALPGAPAAESAASYRAKIEQDLADMQANGVRPKAYAFEGWALLGDLPYVRDVIRRLHARGIKAVLYLRAYVANDTLNTQMAGDYEETMAKGLVAKDAHGGPYIFEGNGGGPATLLDFTNPKTRRWWKERLNLMLGLGMDGYMQDFGEQVQDDMRFHNGALGFAMHNRYPTLYHRVSRKILDRWERKKAKRDPIWFFTRAGYSGRPGSAAHEMGSFPGDETVDWGGASGLRSEAPDMLNRAVGGAFGFTADIGGYLDNLTGPASEELYNRWTEWAALSPYFRVHNSASAGTRMPWFYGAATLARWKAMAALHQRALPLIRSLWRKGRRTGIPPTRPMWLGAPEVPGSAAPGAAANQQWLLGANVLVAPVVHEGAVTKEVALPRGCWRYAPNGQRFRGPAVVTVPAPLGTLPYFTRCGTSPFKAAKRRK
jgi:alpha-glucosidase (family GH31 glycosyl hydrolase)